jgi:hypothetical protein
VGRRRGGGREEEEGRRRRGGGGYFMFLRHILRFMCQCQFIVFFWQSCDLDVGLSSLIKY